MKEKVIVQRLHINKAGEHHYFQINVPREAEKVVGIQSGVSMLTNVFLQDRSLSSNHWLSIKRDKLIGEIQMQTANSSNFFYRGEVVQEDINVGVTDFIQPPRPVVSEFEDVLLPHSALEDNISSVLHFEKRRGIIKNYWRSHQFTHGSKTALDVVMIDNQNVIYGCFKDVIGRTEQKNISYIIQVYVWVN